MLYVMYVVYIIHTLILNLILCVELRFISIVVYIIILTYRQREEEADK